MVTFSNLVLTKLVSTFSLKMEFVEDALKLFYCMTMGSLTMQHFKSVACHYVRLKYCFLAASP